MNVINLPLLIAGGLVAAVGTVLWVLKRAGPWAPAAVAAGVVVLALAFIFPSGPSSDAAVSFVRPSNGERVYADSRVIVTVAVENGAIATSPTDQSGGHLHLYVDGQLQQMPYSTETNIELRVGTHRLRVEYVDERHVPFDPPVDETITVIAVPEPGAVPA